MKRKSVKAHSSCAPSLPRSYLETREVGCRLMNSQSFVEQPLQYKPDAQARDGADPSLARRACIFIKLGWEPGSESCSGGTPRANAMGVKELVYDC